MEAILNKTNEIIDEYESGRWQSVDNLRVLLRNLSTCYYHITKVNIEAAQEYNKEVHLFKGSNAAAVARAEITVPELRISRKILGAMDRVMNAMRSEISTINKES